MSEKRAAGEECPFIYAPGEEPSRPEHPVIGRCERCTEPAFTRLGELVLCWSCAYSEASW